MSERALRTAIPSLGHVDYRPIKLENFDVSFATHGAAQGLPFLMTSQNNHCLVSLVKLTMSQVSDLCLHQLNHHVNPGGHNVDLPPLPMDPSVMIFPEAVPYNHLI